MTALMMVGLMMIARKDPAVTIPEEDVAPVPSVILWDVIQAAVTQAPQWMNIKILQKKAPVNYGRGYLHSSSSIK